jgi:nucleoid DNA-binding protein
MHKEGFSNHIAHQHNITQKAAHDIIDTFTSSVIDAMAR